MNSSSRNNRTRGKNNYNTGMNGENKAVEYLKLRGYNIVEHRYKHAHQEIDIIAVKEKHIYFIEVKTSSIGGAHSYLNSQQLNKYFVLAEYYLGQHQEYNGYEIHFDAIIINGQNIHYIANLID